MLASQRRAGDNVGLDAAALDAAPALPSWRPCRPSSLLLVQPADSLDESLWILITLSVSVTVAWYMQKCQQRSVLAHLSSPFVRQEGQRTVPRSKEAIRSPLKTPAFPSAPLTTIWFTPGQHGSVRLRVGSRGGGRLGHSRHRNTS